MTDLVQVEEVAACIEGVEDAIIGYPEPAFRASLEAMMGVGLEMPSKLVDLRFNLRPDAGWKGAEGLVEAGAVDFRGLFHPRSRLHRAALAGLELLPGAIEAGGEFRADLLEVLQILLQPLVEFAHLFPGEGPDGTFHGFNLGHCGSVSGVHVPARMERRECRRRWWDNPEIGDAGAVGQWRGEARERRDGVDRPRKAGKAAGRPLEVEHDAWVSEARLESDSAGLRGVLGPRI